MADFAQHPVVQALAWALVHFLWQGAVVALAAIAVMRVVRSAASRYAIGVGALVAMIAAPATTFALLMTTGSAPTAAVPAAAAALAEPATRAATDRTIAMSGGTPAFARLLAGAVVVWLAGVTLFSVRLAGGWVLARRVARRAVRPAADHIQALAVHVAHRLALDRAVKICESSLVAVPALVGWIRPTIVLPVAAFAGLTPAQIEALIAHELAHVRRHDYLINVLQSVAEAVLFYHPAVWWISRRVRVERELCCDDIAVGVCDRLVYATALTELAAMSSARFALAATDGDLLSRVRRILGEKESTMSLRSGVAPAFALAVVVGLIVPASLVSASKVPDQAIGEPPRSDIQLSGNVGVSMEPGQPMEITLGDVTFVQQAAQPQRAQEVERVRREAEEQAKKQQLDAAKREVERVRRLYEVGLVTAAQVAEAEMALARIEAGGDAERLRALEIETAKRRVEEARIRAEIGTVSPNEVAELEHALARLAAQEGSREALQVELDAARRRLERSRILVERGLLAPSEVRDVEAAVADLELRLLQHKADEQGAAREKAADARKLRELLEERQKKGVETFEDAGRPIVAGDILSVTIDGEPDLPTTYRIQPDGTIRLPLIGSFKVIGQTPAQVREAIGKRLADARLGSAARVRVMLRRISSAR